MVLHFVLFQVLLFYLKLLIFLFETSYSTTTQGEVVPLSMNLSLCKLPGCTEFTEQFFNEFCSTQVNKMNNSYLKNKKTVFLGNYGF